MLRTHILGGGSSYQATSYGAIRVDYKGNTAEITIKYFNTDDKFQMMGDIYHETKALLTVCTLDQLRNDEFFKEQSHYTQAFHFAHNWILSATNNQLMVYAGEHELAFKLITNNQSVLDVLRKISAAGFCSNLPFFLEQKCSENLKFAHRYESGSSGNFLYNHNETGLTITHGNSKCEIVCEKISDDAKGQLCHSISNLKKVTYLHQWVELNFEINNRMYFSPDLKMCIKERYHSDFPYEALIKNHHHILIYIPMYYEMIIENDMQKHGCSFEKMRLLKGMNEAKLGIITYHYSKIRQLIANGIIMEELAQCDENRLTVVMTNFSDIENNLKMINLKEMLGLNVKLPALYYSANTSFSPTLFCQSSKQSIICEDEVLSDDNDCDVETEIDDIESDSCAANETDSNSESESESSMDEDNIRRRNCYIS